MKKNASYGSILDQFSTHTSLPAIRTASSLKQPKQRIIMKEECDIDIDDMFFDEIPENMSRVITPASRTESPYEAWSPLHHSLPPMNHHSSSQSKLTRLSPLQAYSEQAVSALSVRDKPTQPEQALRQRRHVMTVSPLLRQNESPTPPTMRGDDIQLQPYNP